MSYYPSPAFRFKLRLADGGVNDDAAFAEMSGLDAEIEVEEIKEGGENAFIHRIPGRAKFGNLVLKRGILAGNSRLAIWCMDALESARYSSVRCYGLSIFLLDEAGDTLLAWHCVRAWPVKWQVKPFDSAQNQVAVDTLEFAFHQRRRTRQDAR